MDRVQYIKISCIFLVFTATLGIQASMKSNVSALLITKYNMRSKCKTIAATIKHS